MPCKGPHPVSGRKKGKERKNTVSDRLVEDADKEGHVTPAVASLTAVTPPPLCLAASGPLTGAPGY